MSIRQTFPDVIVLGHDTYRLVTDDAKSWVHFNTSIRNYDDIPRLIKIRGERVPQDMAEEGLVVMRKAS